MSLRAHTLFRDTGAMEPGVERVYVVIDTTTSGTVDTAAAAITRSKCGITVAKTGSETGRYTLTFDGGFVRLLGGSVLIEEDADDAAITVGKAILGVLRGVDESGGVIYLQMVRGDTNADTEVADGARIFVTLDVQLSKALDRA